MTTIEPPEEHHLPEGAHAARSIVHALRGWPTPLGVCINTTAPTPEADEQLAILGEQVVSMAQTFGAAAAIARSA